MKKIIILLLILTTLYGCEKNFTNDNNYNLPKIENINDKAKKLDEHNNETQKSLDTIKNDM